ncbi:MAG: hypothetical protein KF718_31500 [Polyangiaceae bacterium]|nr:hypothetical protein [Polyangiaceae bacterium]
MVALTVSALLGTLTTAEARAGSEFPGGALTLEVIAGAPGTLLEGNPNGLDSSRAGGGLRLALGEPTAFHVRVGYMHQFVGMNEVTRRGEGDIRQTGYTLTRSYVPLLGGVILYLESSDLGPIFLLFEAGAALSLKNREKDAGGGSVESTDEQVLGAAGSFSWGFLFAHPLDLRVGFEIPDVRDARDNREYVFTLSLGLAWELW